MRHAAIECMSARLYRGAADPFYEQTDILREDVF
jgi:hypothetical protein